ncbi:MAG: methionyl-tRNA formyltransferase [Opitutaceae bacterium]|jgi:methionyl-tRNA formyltransferase
MKPAKTEPLRLAFLGSDPIALPLLNWLAEDGRAIAEVVGVFTQPDRPAGRGRTIAANAIKRWASERNIPVRQPERLTQAEREELARLGADLSLVVAYGHILGEKFIETPRLGTLNLHASLLPRYRGASPIQTAIACGERETGVSLMRIVRELDAGPVADCERIAVGELDTAAELEAKVAAACVPLLSRALPLLAAGRLAFVEQDPARASYCRLLSKEDGAVDFGAPARALAARINGLFPWPGCSVDLGGLSVKIGLADSPSEGEPGAASPGTVLGSDGHGLLVSTSAGVIRFRKLQRPGGRMLPASEFLRGFPVAPGTLLPSKAMAALAGPKPFH